MLVLACLFVAPGAESHKNSPIHLLVAMAYHSTNIFIQMQRSRVADKVLLQQVP